MVSIWNRIAYRHLVDKSVSTRLDVFPHSYVGQGRIFSGSTLLMSKSSGAN